MFTALLSLSLLIVVLVRIPIPPVPIHTNEPGRRTVTTAEGRTVEYFTCNDADGDTPTTTAVAVHGFAQTGAVFIQDKLCALYKTMGIKMLAVTQPGFGMSDGLPYGIVRNVKDFPNDVATILQQEHVDKFIVLGQSAGGMHAISLLDAFPDRVLGGFLSAPTCPVDVYEEAGVIIPWAPRIIRYWAALPVIGEVISRILVMFPPRLNFIAGNMESALYIMDPSDLNFFLADMERSKTHSWRSFADNMRVLNSWTKDTFNLTQIKVPVIVVSIMDDGTNPPPMQHWLTKALGNAKLVEIPATGLRHADLGTVKVVGIGLRALFDVQ